MATRLNADFVAVKVDCGERPYIDAVYMNGTQELTGQGRWPMTVFLTPEGNPLYAGTYFLCEQFLQVLGAIAGIWRDEHERAVSTGQQIVEAMRSMTRADEALTSAVAGLRRQVDDARGGFGGAPKFPPSMTLEHLLRHHARTGDADALAMVRRTGEAMARGGLYNQLDGGFARYSVDAAWVVPHFEKMLYHNAQLLRVYTHLWCATGDALAERVVRENAGFLLTRLRTEEGAFASALDADADSVEERTYTWTPAQLVEVLGQDDGARAAKLLSVTSEGTFAHGGSTLELHVAAEQW